MYETIRELAHKRGMSVNEVERKAGMARGTIGKWKISSPTLSSVDRVADVLGIKATTLIDRAKTKAVKHEQK